MGPLIHTLEISSWVHLLSGFLIGIGFGFSLEQAGFSSSRKLVGMFYGYDTTVLKVFFTAAIVAMTGAQFLKYFGWIDMDLVFVNQYYPYAAITGGVIMGAGFVSGGFCPGTGIAAFSIGKVDALVFLTGGLVGAFLFGETYPWIEKIYLANYKGPVKISDSLGMSDGTFILLMIIVAIVMFWLSEKAESKFGRPDITSEI